MLDLDQMCRDAMRRVQEHINRSAGQQKRKMAAGWRKRQIANAYDKTISQSNKPTK